MSYSFDGKISNQSPRFRFNSGDPKPTCEKCCSLIDNPKIGTLAEIDGESIYTFYSYLNTNKFIYETKSGKAIVYCSAYCRSKHNHRFN